MSESSATALNEALVGWLTLHLRRSENQPALLRVMFHGVAGLALSEFGGGLTQLLCLRAADIREQQLDRLGFEITEQERGVLSFRCHSFEVI